MSVNDLFIKGNKLFAEKNFFGGLDIFKEIWLKFPKNKRLKEEIKIKIKKFKVPVTETYSKMEIEEFFNLKKLGKGLTVLTKLTDTLKKDQNDTLTISLLGNFWALEGDYKKAIYFHRLAIEKHPFESVFYLNLSNSLKEINKLKESLNVLHYAKILSLSDKNIDYIMAKLYTDLKNFSKADLIYQELINIKNISKDIIYSYCDNLIKYKKEDDVILFIKTFQKEHINDSTLKSILGLAYYQKKQFELAKSIYLESINLNNKRSKTYSLLGDCFLAVGDFDNAMLNYHKSLDIHPNNKTALNNLASLNYYKGDLSKAEKIFELSLKHNKNNYDAHFNLAQCQLAQGNFSKGWVNYRYRWFASQFNSIKLNTNIPEFNLKKNKKNLLLWSEQGIGDQILFLRFLKELEPHINNLFIKIDPRLHEIICRIYPKINFLDKNYKYGRNVINAQMPIGDIGSLFVTNTSCLIKNKNYLTADDTLTKKLKNNFKTKKKYICGLSWISKNKDIGDKKSISLKILKPILSIKNIEFLDLQYDDTHDERKKFYDNHKIKINKIETIDNFNDLNGVASLIDMCDFIITVSNTNAHLSGALGKKTYLLLPKGKGRLWYWSSKNNKSIWYPTIEVLQQNVAGSWETVINNLSRILKDNYIE